MSLIRCDRCFREIDRSGGGGVLFAYTHFVVVSALIGEFPLIDIVACKYLVCYRSYYVVVAYLLPAVSAFVFEAFLNLLMGQINRRLYLFIVEDFKTFALLDFNNIERQPSYWLPALPDWPNVDLLGVYAPYLFRFIEDPKEL